MLTQRLLIIVIIAMVATSCSNNKGVISYQENKIDQLTEEVNELKSTNATLIKEISELKKTIESFELEAKTEAATNTKNDASSVSYSNESQASLLDIKFTGNSKYNSFLKGGVEIPISIPLSKLDGVIKTAKSYIGTPHRNGGTGRSGIDCSGLIITSFNKHSDVQIPRVAQDISRHGIIIYKMKDLQKGDLVFFTGTTSANRFITHVGIYLGNNEFIHTSSSKGVSVSKLANSYYWDGKFAFGTRVFR